MKNNEKLVICDEDEDYANALAEYFVQKKKMIFQVQVCKTVGSILAMAEEKEIGFLLIEEGLYPEFRNQKIRTKKTFILTGNRIRHIKTKESSIYKFQSGEQIINQFLVESADVLANRELFYKDINREQKVIGVFSPVHRIGKTEYCFELGKTLGENLNVLYLNLEIYGGLGAHFGESTNNLADVLYYAKQEKGNIGLLLATIVKNDGNLDFVPPVSVSEDIKCIEPKEWTVLINRILKESIYETIILDLDEGLPHLYELLDFCTEIHMPTLDDRYAQAKIRQFKNEISLLGKEEILKKINVINRKGGVA